MGYSDLGSYGSEIDTPNLDRLAREGLRYSSFYNAARCCPTRASLLTGLYPHRAGMGWMTAADTGPPGYREDLSRDAITIAEGLKPAGYGTYAAGKWHVTADPDTRPDAEDKSNWPRQRGFDRFYGTFAGGGYFPRKGVLLDNEFIEETDPSFYYTDAISDNAVRFIREHLEKRKDTPFFCYVAYTAPHFPLQAKEADILKYRGKFDEGWDVLRARRLEKLKKIGLVDASCELSPRGGQAWKVASPEVRADMARRMEVYAAMVDCMDQGIGRLVETLERAGELDNTLILFLSDNGSTEEDFMNPGTETDIDRIGRPKYRGMVRREWANLSNAPFKFYKTDAYEGGIATPLVVRWGDHIPDPGTIRQRVGHVIDILPTALEAAGAPYPAEREGHEVPPTQGVSMLASFAKDEPGHETLGWEHQGNRAFRQGKWKVVARGAKSPWELYDLAEDRSESHNLAAARPEIVAQLDKAWTAWAEANHVLPLDDRPWSERTKKGD